MKRKLFIIISSSLFCLGLTSLSNMVSATTIDKDIGPRRESIILPKTITDSKVYLDPAFPNENPNLLAPYDYNLYSAPSGWQRRVMQSDHYHGKMYGPFPEQLAYTYRLYDWSNRKYFTRYVYKCGSPMYGNKLACLYSVTQDYY